MSVVVSVELSPVAGGLLRTWSDAGSQLWQVWGGDVLADTLGRGQLARSEVEPGRFREVGLLELANGGASERDARLLLPARRSPRRGADPAGDPMEIALAADVLSLSAVGHVDLSRHAGRLWSSLVVHLSELCVEAAERGEFLVLERGAVGHEPWPYALFGVARDDDGSWLSHLETSPAPDPTASGWEQAGRGGNPDGTDGASMSAPATFEAVGAAGFLLAVAASAWAAVPQDVVITYAAAPSGPVEVLPA